MEPSKQIEFIYGQKGRNIDSNPKVSSHTSINVSHNEISGKHLYTSQHPSELNVSK
jgi:hypothetical protein